MEIKTVFELAEQNRVTVDYFPLPRSGAMSLCFDGSCYIAIDPWQLKGDADEKVKLCHELGHCVTGSFYSPDNYCDLRGRHEYRANKWAVRQLVPLEDLREAISAGYTEPWELSEYFDVPEAFMRRACEYYRSHGFSGKK